MNASLEKDAAPSPRAREDKGTRTFSQKVLNAGFWSLLLRGAARSIGFIRNIILARLLAPEDIGLFGITLVVLSVLESFSNTGLQSAVVQKKEDVQEYLNTVWTIQVLRGVGLGVGLILAAPYIAGFFEEPGVTALVRVLGGVISLKGLSNPGTLHFRRELEYKPQFIQRFGGTTLDLVVSVVLAFVLRNAWALMWGMVAGVTSRIIFSYLLHSFRPRFHLEWGRARELSTFARWIFLNRILFFLAYRGDNFVIGKVLGAPALGIYMLAYSIAEVVTVEISSIMTEVAFPAYSRIQGRMDRLREAFLMGTELISTIAFPLAVVLYLLAEPITTLLLGERWIQVASVLPLLALAGAVRAVGKNGSVAFGAVGRPSSSFVVNVIGVITTYTLMFLLIGRFGLVGVAIAVAGGPIASVVPFLWYTYRHLGIAATAIGRRLVLAVILSGVVGGTILGVERVVPASSTPALIGTVALCGLLYLVVALMSWKISSQGPIAMMLQLWNRARSKTPSPLAESFGTS